MTAAAAPAKSKTINSSYLTGLKPASKAYKVGVGGRLCLMVSPKGTKTWAWSFRYADRDCTISFGRFPAISLSEARDARAAAEKLLASGRHPGEVAKAEQQKAMDEAKQTLAAVAREWLAKHSPKPDDPAPHVSGKWSHAYTYQVRLFVGKYLIDAPIGQRPIGSITSADIFHVVDAVANRSKTAAQLKKDGERNADGAPAVAALLKQWAAKIFSYAIATGRAHSNAAAGFDLADSFKRPPVQNHRPLSESELRALLRALPGYQGQRETAIALELLALTALRTVELRAGRWEEIDFDSRTWVIPQARMKVKNGGAHVVPLSVQAIAALQELRMINPPAADGTGYLWPNRLTGSEKARNPCMSASTLNRALVGLGFNGPGTVDFSSHGFRSTFSTAAHELRLADSAAVEAQLAHADRNRIRGIYNKARYLPERQALMQRWGDFLDGLKADVVDAADHQQAA